jgi:pimeloyl-ACP methyl ester carboxylesterase
LVFAHATGFHGLVWKPLAQRLAPHFHCVGFDFRGHGTSSLPDSADLAWRSLADDLIAVVDAASSQEPVRVVGHSMGGAAIALAAADNPARFVSGWTFEPILLPWSSGLRQSPLSRGAKLRRADFASRQAAMVNYHTKPPLSVLHHHALLCYVDHGFVDLDDGTVTIACRPETESLVYQNAASGADEAAARVSMPYALVVGADPRGPGDMARAVAPRSERLHLIEMDLTHFGPLEDPDAVAAAIVSWFDV